MDINRNIRIQLPLRFCEEGMWLEYGYANNIMNENYEKLNTRFYLLGATTKCKTKQDEIRRSRFEWIGRNPAMNELNCTRNISQEVNQQMTPISRNCTCVRSVKSKSSMNCNFSVPNFYFCCTDCQLSMWTKHKSQTTVTAHSTQVNELLNFMWLIVRWTRVVNSSISELPWFVIVAGKPNFRLEFQNE